jgi:hypothetical protein
LTRSPSSILRLFGFSTAEDDEAHAVEKDIEMIRSDSNGYIAPKTLRLTADNLSHLKLSESHHLPYEMIVSPNPSNINDASDISMLEFSIDSNNNDVNVRMECQVSAMQLCFVDSISTHS